MRLRCRSRCIPIRKPFSGKSSAASKSSTRIGLAGESDGSGEAVASTEYRVASEPVFSVLATLCPALSSIDLQIIRDHPLIPLPRQDALHGQLHLRVASHQI